MRTRIDSNNRFFSQLEKIILNMLEEQPSPLAVLTARINQHATQEALPYSNFSQPEIACVARDLYAQRKIEYKKGLYAINLRGVL